LSQILAFDEQTPFTIMRDAVKKHGVKKFYVLLSGGKNSIVVAHFVATNFPEQFGGCVFTNTGFGSHETREFVIQYCLEMGWKLFMTWPKEEERFYNVVMRYGFGGPGNHNLVMGYLKHHSWRQFIADHKVENPCLISGVFKKESKSREYKKQYSKKPIDKDGDMIFVKPFFYKTAVQFWDYFMQYKLKKSPTYEWFNKSGECFCGCYGNQWELQLMKEFDPLAFEYIQWLEARIKIRIKELDEEIIELGRGIGKNILSQFVHHAKKSKMESLIKNRDDLINYGTWGHGPTTTDIKAQTLLDDYCGESCQVT